MKKNILPSSRPQSSQPPSGQLSTKLLIFDFDGVIAQSQTQLLEAMQKVAKQMNIELPSPEVLRNTEARLGLKQMKMGPLKAYRFVSACQKSLELEPSPPIFAEMKELLVELRKTFVLGIVSSSHPKRISTFLEREQLNDIFGFVKTGVPLWSKHKVLWDILVQYKPSKAYYVGDEERDILAAQKAGVQSVAVGWGLKSAELLQRYSPTFFAESPKNLLALMKSC